MAGEHILNVFLFSVFTQDFKNLEERDLTMTGDGGTPLSEGQKARVSLAR